MNEAEFLAGMMRHSHEHTLAHIDKLRHTDMHRRFQVGDVSLNSAYWLFAHTVVSKNWLVLRGTGGPFQKFSWAKAFNIGTTPPPPEACPPFDEVEQMIHHIQQLSLDHVAGLTPEMLEAPHHAMLVIPENNFRGIIKYHIRHESMHNGQLSWLCKLHGLKTI